MATVEASVGTSTDAQTQFQDALEQQPDPLQYDVKWPVLATLAKHVKRTGWHACSMPAELTSLPDDFQVPGKLQDILNWSITSGDGWASPPPSDALAETIEGPSNSSNLSNVDVVDDQEQSTVLRRDSQATDQRSIHSRLSSAVVSDTSSARFAAEKTAWKSKFLGKLAWRKPIAKRAPVLRPPTPTAECIVCFEDIPVTELLQIDACHHYYCKECLSRHIVVAMGSESAFPPKCCLSAIPLHTILLSLDNRQREQYQAKTAEYSLAPGERWYCPRTTCTKWIPPSRLSINRQDTNYSCPFCSESICRTCRGSGHARGAECPQDFGLEQTLEVAELEGWQRCYRCHALVEHTYGCRHMTCKCKAEFCYVCNARWQTCHCTETDANNRRADLNRRRQERIDAANAELEEIARAIAEVEAMERAEAEARRVREEKRQQEEAEQLAALEQLRLEEEAARQAAEEEAERQWHEVIRRSFDDDWQHLQTLMFKVLHYQQTAMNSRHASENDDLDGGIDGLVDNLEIKYANMIRRVNDRYAQKRTALRSQHSEESEKLEARHEEEEDDMFVQNQVRLRGKANKEQRMERMLTELRKAQSEVREELSNKHTQTLYILEVRKNVDLTGINGARTGELEKSKGDLEQKLFQAGVGVGADRKYFEIVTKRRLAMLALHRKVALEEIADREEPRGLQDWHAVTIDPVLPDLDFGEEALRTTSYHSARTSRAGPITSNQTQSAANRDHGIVPRVVESADLYGNDESVLETQAGNVGIPRSFPREDMYLQPMPPPSNLPPTPPSSSVSIEAPYARRVTSETIRRLEDSSQLLTPVSPNPRGDPFMSVPRSRDRGNSFAGSAVSAESSEHRSSFSSTTKKGRSWFGRRKEISEDEFRRKMRDSVGDAF